MLNKNTLPGDSVFKAATNKWMHQIAVIAIMMVLYSGWLRAMVWIISRRWWKTGHRFPQQLHKHVFSTLSWERLFNADIAETAHTPPLPHTPFGHCTATHSWHPFRGALPIRLAYSWPKFGCFLHVRTTSWLTGSSFRNWRKSSTSLRLPL